MTSEQRERLLDLLRTGHDLAVSCATADIDIDAVKADGGLMLEAGKAFAIGTGRLRKRLLEMALKGGSPGMHILERQLADREAQQRQFPTERAKGADDIDDGYWQKKLELLSTEECELLEWYYDRDADPDKRPVPELHTHAHWMFLRGCELAEQRRAEWAAAAEREREVQSRMRPIGELPIADDPREPLERSRSVVPIPPLDELSLRNGGTVVWDR
jgi:hypothetical protein